MSTENPLVEVSKQVRNHAGGKRVAVIFDLDSTLFCVSPRTQAILRELGSSREFADLYPEASLLLRAIEVLPTDYSLRGLLARLQQTPSPQLALAVHTYWEQHFFSNRHLDKDLLYPSAQEYVTHLHTLGAEILYLTGREDALMRTGTVEALRRWGFPQFEDSTLYMKPSGAETDEHFKVAKLKELVARYDHLWFFENEPVIIHDVLTAVPKVQVVYVDSVHSGRAPAPVGLPTVKPDYRAGVGK